MGLNYCNSILRTRKSRKKLICVKFHSLCERFHSGLCERIQALLCRRHCKVSLKRKMGAYLEFQDSCFRVVVMKCGPILLDFFLQLLAKHTQKICLLYINIIKFPYNNMASHSIVTQETEIKINVNVAESHSNQKQSQIFQSCFACDMYIR